MNGCLPERTVINVRFDMEISLTRWKSNGSVSVDMGPLTYSVKIKEKLRAVPAGEAGGYEHLKPHLWDNYELLPLSPWNYGLPSEELDLNEMISVGKRTDRIASQPFTLETAPITLIARARKIPAWKLQDDTAAELCMSPVFVDTEEEEIELVPLACARLRISCFPVVTHNPSAAPWVEAPETIPPDSRRKGFPDPFAS